MILDDRAPALLVGHKRLFIGVHKHVYMAPEIERAISRSAIESIRNAHAQWLEPHVRDQLVGWLKKAATAGCPPFHIPSSVELTNSLCTIRTNGIYSFLIDGIMDRRDIEKEFDIEGENKNAIRASADANILIYHLEGRDTRWIVDNNNITLTRYYFLIARFRGIGLRGSPWKGRNNPGIRLSDDDWQQVLRFASSELDAGRPPTLMRIKTYIEEKFNTIYSTSYIKQKFNRFKFFINTSDINHEISKQQLFANKFVGMKFLQ